MNPTAPQTTTTTAAAEVAIFDFRRQLLAGRGPGATGTEVAKHTRARTTLAGRPITKLREDTSQQTAAIRGDLDALSDHAAAAGRQFAATMTALRRTAGHDARKATVRLALIAGSAGIALGITATIITTRRHRANRGRRLSRDPEPTGLLLS